MSALLEDIVSSLPEDAEYAYVARRVHGQVFSAFGTEIRSDVFSKEDVMVVHCHGSDVIEMIPIEEMVVHEYTITEHLADEDDRVFYAGEMSGLATFYVPKELLEGDWYVLLQDTDVVRIVDTDECGEYDNYVYSSWSKPFEGIVVFGAVAMLGWAIIGEGVYKIPETIEVGSYWFEVGFKEIKMYRPYATQEDDTYSISIVHNAISGVSPQFPITTMVYGRIKNGQYNVKLPDLDDTKCSVLCILADVLIIAKHEHEDVVVEEAEKDLTAEQLAQYILDLIGDENEKGADVVMLALQHSVDVMESMFLSDEQEETPVASAQVDEEDDPFSDFDLEGF